MAWTGVHAPTAAKTPGLGPAQWKRALADGQSIADLAQEKGVQLQAVKDAMLAAGTAHLADLVRQGKLTQAQADERQRDLPALIDRLVALKPGKEAGDRKP